MAHRYIYENNAMIKVYCDIMSLECNTSCPVRAIQHMQFPVKTECEILKLYIFDHDFLFNLNLISASMIDDLLKINDKVLKLIKKNINHIAHFTTA